MSSPLESFGFTGKIVGTYLTRKPDGEALMTAIIATLVLFLTTMWVWFSPQGLEELTVSSGKTVFENKEYWRLWTAAVTHADVGHLMSNSLLFFVLGYFLAGYFGIVMFPTLALIMGGLINSIALSTYGPTVNLLGASGIVYWMGGVWLVLYLLIDTRRSWGSRWLRVLGVGILMFVPSEAFEPAVSYRTHFIGFLVGNLTGLLYYAANAKRLRSAEVIEWIPPEVDDEADALRA